MIESDEDFRELSEIELECEASARSWSDDLGIEVDYAIVPDIFGGMVELLSVQMPGGPEEMLPPPRPHFVSADAFRDYVAKNYLPSWY